MAMLWQDSSFIKNVPVVGTKSWVMTRVFKGKIVLFVQRNILATPQYQIRKDKKSGILVSPSKVTVVGPVDASDEFPMPDNHAQLQAGSCPSPVSFIQQHSGDFVSRQD